MNKKSLFSKTIIGLMGLFLVGLSVALFQNCAQQFSAIDGTEVQDYANKPPLDFEGMSVGQRKTANPLSCAEGTSLCASESSDSQTCCNNSTQQCIVYKKSAYCGPKGPGNCPVGTTFCAGGGGVDTTCCKAGDECKVAPWPFEKWCYCDQTASCKSPNKVCGKKCCTSDQECVGSGHTKGCSPKSCKANETKCSGVLGGEPYSICCAQGYTCSPSSDGTPSCFVTPTTTTQPPTPVSPAQTPSPGAGSTPSASPGAPPASPPAQAPPQTPVPSPSLSPTPTVTPTGTPTPSPGQ